MSMLEAGRLLAHYEILSKIGEGGMGEVYRARDTRLGREVALKVLPAEVSGDPSRTMRFEREARAVAALNHPNIITLHSIEEEEGIRFLTMELVHGETLAEVITCSSRAGGLPHRRFVDLAVPIVNAISAAHAQGITHRDLKPQNILITTDGRPKVLDFGLAKQTLAVPKALQAQDPTAVMTADGAIVGTVSYMSPEQALGDPIDERSDLFSLGVVFYEMITGRRPFEASTAIRIIDNLVHSEPEPIESGGDPALAEIARIIAKCMRKERERRYQSAAELRVDLENLLTANATAAPVTSLGRDRRRALQAGVAAAVVIAAIGLYVALRPAGEAPGSSVTDAATSSKTIAVLPFRNLSADQQNEFFAQGVHEDLMTKLASIRNLKVISRTSVMKFAKPDRSLRAVGTRLDARYVVEGSVRREANQVRIIASLSDTTTGQTLWSASYDRELVSVFALQSAIAQEIASKLEMKISPVERKQLDAVPTVVVTAYDDFLKARRILNGSRWDHDQLQQAIAHLRDATGADPQFAEGWALLARAQSDLVKLLRDLDGREPDAKAAAADARATLERARQLAPGSVATLRAAGYFHETVEADTVKALRSLDQALALVPDDSETLFFQAQIYFRVGRIGDVVSNMERAYAVDNANGFLTYGLTLAYEMSRQYAKMPAFFDRLLVLEPEKTHYAVHARYYQFLSDGTLTSFHALEEAVRNVRKTERCDIRSVQDREMVVALVNRDFDRYARNWEGKWDRHHRGHGDWACPAQLNEEANHAMLLLTRGDVDLARKIVAKARSESAKPITVKSGMCIFDREAFTPKLDFLDGNKLRARADFDRSVMKILANQEVPRGAIEQAVLLETADMVAPDQVYALYREIVGKPLSLLGLEVVCANPWTYPNLLKDPRFIAEVRRDGRFVQFLETYGIIPRA